MRQRFFRLLDRLARVLGHLPFAALLNMMGPAMKRMPLPPDRREVLAASSARMTRASYGGQFTVTFSTWTGTVLSRHDSVRPGRQPG